MDGQRSTGSASQPALEGFFTNRPYSSHLLSKLATLPLNEVRVLDLGCGQEMIDLKAFARAGSALSVGVDMFEDPSAKAEAGQVHYVRADIDDFDLPFTDGSFNLVLMHNVIEHIHDPLGVLSEAKRLLELGGYLSVITENQASLKNRMKMALGGSVYFPVDRFLGDEDRVVKKGRSVFTGHIREYTVGELKRAISRSGLEVESVVLHPAASSSGRDFDKHSTSAADSMTKLSKSKGLFYMYHLAELAVPSWRYMTSVLARKP